MLPIQILLVLTSCSSVGTAILEKVGEADLDAVRIRLEDEKAKRLLLENDVEVLMLKVEELKRGFSQMSEDNKASQGSVTTRKTGITTPSKTMRTLSVSASQGSVTTRKTGITTPSKTMRTTIGRFDSDEYYWQL